ncbi:hypothetical protein HPB48_011564 [Haemaphysalis longicornis]|uniref:Uncharacterized protein n=1 Tax=Haemaphysalis longicornis TaxID=44386 RepID=A0A9J6G1H3_HAELO|nr:hypothetical protein HPB48_011564 [Haemaphysalis longicornis]
MSIDEEDVQTGARAVFCPPCWRCSEDCLIPRWSLTPLVKDPSRNPSQKIASGPGLLLRATTPWAEKAKHARVSTQPTMLRGVRTPVPAAALPRDARPDARVATRPSRVPGFQESRSRSLGAVDRQASVGRRPTHQNLALQAGHLAGGVQAGRRSLNCGPRYFCVRIPHRNHAPKRDGEACQGPDTGSVLVTSLRPCIRKQRGILHSGQGPVLCCYLILDEGRKIKSRTKTTKAVCEVPAKNRLVLAGTAA